MTTTTTNTTPPAPEASAPSSGGHLADRLLRRPAGTVSRSDLAGHVAIHGALALPKREDRNWCDTMLTALSESGLLGRGGAGFPAAVKWDSARRSARRPLLVVNAMEGEPASAKDRVLLSYSPHLVLDGAEVAAAVIGATDVVVCVPDDSGPAAASVQSAIDERSRAGGSRRRFTVARPPGRYVAGEESALVNWLTTRQALPAMRIDKSVPLTVGRRPTLVHNAETLAQVALIARYGQEWFRRAGTHDAPGTTLVTVTGAVRSPGVVEVELGTPVVDILVRAGVDATLSGVLLGGYGGAWLDPARLDTPYAPAPLAAVGATHGVGIIIAVPSTSCGVAETARIVRYMAGQSAGQCGPCVFGLPAIADDLELLWAGRADPDLIARIERRADLVDGRGACRHPDGVARLVRSALRVFDADVRSHAEGRPCPGHTARTVLTLPAAGQGSAS
jgi:NADH:ubiquinone oxidoreductase subunit F (NADH-binding)